MDGAYRDQRISEPMKKWIFGFLTASLGCIGLGVFPKPDPDWVHEGFSGLPIGGKPIEYELLSARASVRWSGDPDWGNPRYEFRIEVLRDPGAAVFEGYREDGAVPGKFETFKFYSEVGGLGETLVVPVGHPEVRIQFHSFGKPSTDEIKKRLLRDFRVHFDGFTGFARLPAVIRSRLKTSAEIETFRKDLSSALGIRLPAEPPAAGSGSASDTVHPDPSTTVEAAWIGEADVQIDVLMFRRDRGVDPERVRIVSEIFQSEFQDIGVTVSSTDPSHYLKITFVRSFSRNSSGKKLAPLRLKTVLTEILKPASSER